MSLPRCDGPLFGAQRGAKMRPKCDLRRTKNEDKNEDKKNALEDRLGAVLGRSWLVLGVVLGSCLLILSWFLYYFVTNEVFEKIRCQEAT